MDYFEKELTRVVENNLIETINSIGQHDWDEDFITRTMLRDLKNNLSSIEHFGQSALKGIDWQAYKLKGKDETNFGDIAIIVELNYRDGTSLEGVAFLEAKKRDWRKSTFSAMNKPQLNKILKNAPRANYLLYDYENITGFHCISSMSRDYDDYHYNERGVLRLSPISRIEQCFRGSNLYLYY